MNPKKEDALEDSAAVALMQELAQVGFVHNHVDELRKSGTTYRAAIPVLLKWLPHLKAIRLKEAVVRVLSVPWAKPEAARVLIREFQRFDFTDDSYRWAVGNALEVVADLSVLDDLLKIAEDSRYGTARQMVVLALGRVKSHKVTDVLIELLKDKDVRGHAIAALGNQGHWSSIAAIKPLLTDTNSWIRKEAHKAIKKIENRVMKVASRVGTKSRKTQ